MNKKFIKKNVFRILFIISIQVFVYRYPFTYSNEEIPAFTINVHMPTHNIYGTKESRVGFRIIGLGNIEYGAIHIGSDTNNVIQNSYSLSQGIMAPEGFIEISTINNTRMKRKLVQGWVMLITPVNLKEYETHEIIGNFKIYTKGMNHGKYSIKIVLLIKNDGKNYIFEESVEYNIITFSEKYLPHILTSIASISVSIIVYFIIEWIKSKRANSRQLDSNIILFYQNKHNKNPLRRSGLGGSRAT